MAKPTVKRNKAAARSCVMLGTLLAGTAIWFSVTSAAKPVSQSTPAPGSSSSTTISAAGNISVAPQTTLFPATPAQPQAVPRLRTQGS
jgi:hypothetical protein